MKKILINIVLPVFIFLVVVSLIGFYYRNFLIMQFDTDNRETISGTVLSMEYIKRSRSSKVIFIPDYYYYRTDYTFELNGERLTDSANVPFPTTLKEGGSIPILYDKKTGLYCHESTLRDTLNFIFQLCAYSFACLAVALFALNRRKKKPDEPVSL